MVKKLSGLVKEFNQPDCFMMISSYPERGVRYSGKVCAVGGFAKNTIEGIKEHFANRGINKKIVVLTIAITDEEIYQEKNILVWRVFKRNNPFSYLNLLAAINKFSKIKNVLIEFEFASFGNTITTVLFPLILLYLFLQRKKTTLVLHQVLADLKNLSGHLGWKKIGFKERIFNYGLRSFYYLVVFLSQKVIVLEEALRKQLINLVGMENKIIFIPHGVDNKIKFISKDLARKKLRLNKDEIIILYFGYLTWYKGVDFLIKVFAKNNLKINNQAVRLIIAGGESRTQKTKFQYQDFVNKVYAFLNNRNTIITGFINERDFNLYFRACDLVVLPYRTFMSSSGPLSLAFSFKKPFILSTALKPYFESYDFLSTLAILAIRKEEIIFQLKEKIFINKLKYIFKNNRLAKLVTFSELLGKNRNFSCLASRYVEVLEVSEKNFNQSLIINKLPEIA